MQRMRADGYTTVEVADIFDCCPETVRYYAPGRPGKVPVASLREAFLASSITAAEVARRIGWIHSRDDGRSYADSARVKRTLGILPDISGSTGRQSWRTLTDAETVERIAYAIGISPWSVLPDEDEAA